jgi:hypothetical protein
MYPWISTRSRTMNDKGSLNRGRNVLLLIIFVSLLLVASADAITVTAGEAQGAQGSIVQVPVSFDGAVNVGSMDLTLRYDPEIARAIGTGSGTLAGTAYLEYNTASPGVLHIALADSRGISGSGPVVMITFRLQGSAGSSTPLTIEQLVLHDAELAPIAPASRDGTIQVTESAGVTQAGGAITAALLTAGGLLTAVLFTRRNREGQP